MLGTPTAVADMVRVSIHRAARSTRRPVSTAWVRSTVGVVVGELESRRAAWQIQHVRAEAQRQVRDAAIPADRLAEVVEWVVDAVLERA